MVKGAELITTGTLLIEDRASIPSLSLRLLRVRYHRTHAAHRISCLRSQSPTVESGSPVSKATATTACRRPAATPLQPTPRRDADSSCRPPARRARRCPLALDPAAGAGLTSKRRWLTDCCSNPGHCVSPG